MKSDRHREHDDGRHTRGHLHKEKDHKRQPRGAKTFRRGRAIAFLERMELKRSTLKKQLEMSELQTINPILVGELKAIDMVIDEFVQLFELYEFVEMDLENQKSAIMTDCLLASEKEKEDN